MEVLIFFAVLLYGIASAMINPSISKLILISTLRKDVGGVIGFHSMIKFFTNSIATLLFNFYASFGFNTTLMEYYVLFCTAILCNFCLIILISKRFFYSKYEQVKIS